MATEMSKNGVNDCGKTRRRNRSKEKRNHFKQKEMYFLQADVYIHRKKGLDIMAEHQCVIFVN